MPAENDLGDWFRGVPIVTRWWFCLSIVFTLLGRFGVLNIMYMFLSFEFVVYKFQAARNPTTIWISYTAADAETPFVCDECSLVPWPNFKRNMGQIWRLFTCVVFYPLTPQTGFHYLINLYFLYSYSTRLETGLFDGRPADHLFMLLFNTVILIIIGFLANIFFLMDPLVLSVLYIWCQINRDMIVQFWFGMQFKAMYLPWVLAVFNMVVGGGGMMELIGIFVGHLFFFLMFKYPQDFGGARFINTPSFLYKLLPNRRGGVSGFGMPPASRRAADNGDGGGGRHQWGQGRRLEEDD